MDDSSRRKRRLVLVLLAVIVPSLAILGLGVLLLTQEARLADSRRSDTFEAAFRDFASTLDSLGRRVVESDSLVVFTGAIREGRLELPWQASSTPGQFKTAVYRGRFGSLLERAEAAEFGGTRAVEAYETALAAADTPLRAAFARLALARLYSRDGQLALADSVRHLVAAASRDIVDEFGVPLSLYALASEPAPFRLLAALSTHAERPLSVSPQAAYLYRSFRDSLRALEDAPEFARFDRFVEESMAAVRLQDDFTSLYPLLLPRGDGVPGWALYANDTWLLTLSPDLSSLGVYDAADLADRAARASALDSRGFRTPSLTSASTPPNRYLSPRFAGVYSLMVPAPGASIDPSRLRMTFVLLAALLVIGLLALGVVLLWRDTHREVETARLRSQFVSSVSHELKTPLTSIRMYAETLRHRQQDDSVRNEYLDTIVGESGRLTRLLDNVLDFSRMEKGPPEFVLAPVVLQSVVSTALEALSHSVRSEGFRVVSHSPEENVIVKGDADALEQVMLNLFSNALKYSGASRDVEISITPNGSTATVRVTDHGIGIHDDDLGHIFEPYFRAVRAPGPRIAGTGLGLAIVRQTVEAHGGHIDIESRPGEGTSVTVTLPSS